MFIFSLTTECVTCSKYRLQTTRQRTAACSCIIVIERQTKTITDMTENNMTCKDLKQRIIILIEKRKLNFYIIIIIIVYFFKYMLIMCHMRPLLTLDTAKAMAVAIVGSRLDYCNSMLYGMSQTNINMLQRVQNILVRVVSRAPWTVSSVDICHNLHWLPLNHRVTFKLCLITWKTLHTTHPPYLSELITHYHPSRALHSSNTNLLTTPSGITSNFTSQAFLFPHHPPGTHCLHTSALLTNYQPSNVN